MQEKVQKDNKGTAYKGGSGGLAPWFVRLVKVKLGA